MRKVVVNKISYHGRGSLSSLGHIVRSRRYQRIFVCSDPDLVKFGVTKKVLDVLDENGRTYCLYTKVEPNPSIECVLEALNALKESESDCIIAVGGGSSMDLSKAIGVVYANPEFSDIRSLEGAVTKHKTFPIVAIPTTAGTGSEVSISYVITDNEKKRKFVATDHHCLPNVAIVDPDMMASMPPKLTAATGMDALTHAIEAYLSKNAWEISDMYALKAIELIAKNLRESVKGNPDAREQMALAQYLAACAFSNSGLGICHSMAHALGAFYHTPHGLANAILLPAVMTYNAPIRKEKYKAIATAMGADTYNMNLEETIVSAIVEVKKLARDIEIPNDLKGITNGGDLFFLANSVMKDACLPSNPREPVIQDIIDIYKSLL